MTRSHWPAFTFVVVALFLPLTVHAQVGPVDGATATPIPGTGHDYLQDMAETISPADGSVSVRIKTPVPSGRGITLPFSFNYDSNGVYAPKDDQEGGVNFASNLNFMSSGGWAYGIPRLDVTRILVPNPGYPNRPCVVYTSYAFTDANGTRHSLNDAESVTATVAGCPASVNNYGDTQFQSFQGSAFLSLSDADGTTYGFEPGAIQSPNGEALTSLPSIEDRNGNFLNFTPNSSTGGFTAQDTLSRTVISASGFGTTGNTVAISGLQAPNTLTWGTSTLNDVSVETKTISTVSGCAGFDNPFSGSNSVVTAIELPNGQSFQFGYDPTYGLLNSITYPAGNYVTYTWEQNPNSAYIAVNALHVTGVPQCGYQYATFAVAHRYVYNASRSLILQQDFTYSTTWNSAGTAWTSKQTTVKTTDWVTGNVFNTIYTYTPESLGLPPFVYDEPAPQLPLESTIVHQDGSGHTLRTESKWWFNQFELQKEQVTLDNGLTSETDYTYGSGAQVTEKWEYDFGTSGRGNLLRNTITNYQAFGNTPIFSSEPSIFDKPCQRIVYDGSGNRQAETDYYYDNGSVGTPCAAAGTPLVSSAGGSSLTGHDETNYGVNSATCAGKACPRGNVTQKTQWASTGTSPVTTYTYDETGQRTSMTDPNGNVTAYSYVDNYLSTNTGAYTTTAGAAPSGEVTNAYVTKITYPKTGSTNHIVSFTYGYNDGELTTATDENSQTTTYRYNDNLDRITETDYPDGGQTAQSYSDAGPSPSVTTTKLITASVSMSSTAFTDGMGGVVETEVTTDPEGKDYVNTTYDGLERPYKVLNPYRTTSDSTYGIAAHIYDALGRACLVVPPDFAGSAPTSCPTTAPAGDTFTSYSGNQTTVTDEAGNQRTSVTDGLGRLIQVFENPSGLNYETDYAYDVFGNLLSVNQKGGSTTSSNWRTRTFTYDSLSRLTSAANPESGTITITYGYDANGNVITKTALSPNQPSTGTATVVTTYTYDTLNRLTHKSYNDGYTSNSSTPGASYAYDGSTLTGCTIAPPGVTDSYPVGRRTSMCDGSGGTSWSHDTMGRILQERRTIGTIKGEYENDAFNLDGSVASVTSLGYGVTYTYSGAERPLTALHSATNLVTGATYAPPGDLAGMTLGSATGFAGITVANAYNNRLQPILLSAASPSGTVFSECFDFHLGVAVAGPTPCSFSANAAGDNGNVYQIVNNRDNTRNQSFTYDTLNRITSAQSSGTQWGETFTIDAWSNLTNRAEIAGKTNYEPLSTSAGISNQLSGFGYDAAGNMTSNGSESYVYDDENRLIATAGDSYIYDGDGQRVEKCTEGTTPGTCATSATGTLYWRGSGSAPLTETDLSGTVKTTYIFFNGQRVARIDSAGAIHFYFSDHLGSHGVVENATGSACEQDIDYYPYGGVENDYCPNVAQNYKFTGKERDSESGLDHFEARYYTSNIGRFMTPDWAARPTAVPYAVFGDPQSLNLYVYVRNDPVTRADLDGHQDTNGAAADCGDAPCSGKGSTDNGPSGPAQNKGTDSTKVAKGAGEFAFGGLLTYAAIAGAGETGGGTLAALGLYVAVVGGETTAAKGVIDMANGAGKIDDRTAENGKENMDLATNPASATALTFTNQQTAKNIGNVANVAMGVRDLTQHPNGVLDTISKGSSFVDIVQSGVQLFRQAVTSPCSGCEYIAP